MLACPALRRYPFDTANFRERLKDNPFVESLSENSRKPDEKQLQEDMAYVDRKNSLVQSLMMWRDNVVAHRNTHYIISQKNLGDDYPLTIENIEELLTKADEILNRYAILFSAGAYSMHIIGEDDYKFVLKSIRVRLDLQKQQLEEELKQYADKGLLGAPRLC